MEKATPEVAYHRSGTSVLLWEVVHIPTTCFTVVVKTFVDHRVLFT